MVLAASRGGKDIKDYKACNDDDTSVHFEITMIEKQDEGEGKLKKYDTPEELLEDFYRLRLNFYVKRKTSLLHKLKILENKEKFAHEVWDEEFDFLEKPKSEKCAELKKKDLVALDEQLALGILKQNILKQKRKHEQNEQEMKPDKARTRRDVCEGEKKAPAKRSGGDMLVSDSDEESSAWNM
nr:DNA topoisomerase 2 [Tanacetum cinerariifolium]